MEAKIDLLEWSFRLIQESIRVWHENQFLAAIGLYARQFAIRVAYILIILHTRCNDNLG